jgi:hypothetical protein
MGLVSIEDFCKQLSDERRTNGNILSNINWNEELERAGYHNVRLAYTYTGSWREIHDWCRQQFGKEHYAWTGYEFWFDDPKNATLFVLRWN